MKTTKLVLAGLASALVALIALDASVARAQTIGSGCPAVSAAVVPTPKGTRIHAVWPVGACSGLKGR